MKEKTHLFFKYTKCKTLGSINLDNTVHEKTHTSYVPSLCYAKLGLHCHGSPLGTYGGALEGLLIHKKAFGATFYSLDSGLIQKGCLMEIDMWKI